MRPRRLTLARLVRALAAPLVVALPPLFWVVEATERASRTPLGRDQGIFQFVAWALRNGAVDYRDVRDVNGPLTHLVHFVLLALGGADEHRFRLLDLAVTGATFAFAGACLPGLRSKPASALDRVAWALAGWVVLSGQYLLYGYWDIAQRESFFDWFLLPSLALQLLAQGSRPAKSARGQAWLLAAAGALSVIPWFGKPTYAIFTVLQAGVLAADGGGLPFFGRRAALRAFALGGLAGAATQLAFLFAYGDAAAFLRIQFVDVPAMYRFIWPRSPGDMFSEPWRASQAIYALVGGSLVSALVASGEMPRRALLLALAPLCALAGVAVQGKGFPYHFHPVTATVHLQALAFCAWLQERTRVAQRRRAFLRLAPAAASALLALRVATAMEDSPHLRATWLLWGGHTAEDRRTREYFSHFPETDYFPFELRQAADYLRSHTEPTDRVQTYGMDAYVLFLARRRSATPYIYAYDLDADAALAGGTGGQPDAAQAERIVALRDSHEADLLAELESRPAGAFLFIDGSPLLSEGDAWVDFEEHCPRAARWVRARYRESVRFGHDRVWLPVTPVAGGSPLPRGPSAGKSGSAGEDGPTAGAP